MIATDIRCSVSSSFERFHREGIDFAAHGDRHTNEAVLPPPNLTFLDVLSELANKLIKQDKRVILQYLTGQINCPSNADAKWQSFILYRNCLLQGEDVQLPMVANITAPQQAVSVMKRSRGRPSKISSKERYDASSENTRDDWRATDLHSPFLKTALVRLQKIPLNGMKDSLIILYVKHCKLGLAI
uniref:Uncharacterized protein n=1 Tax=Romanomermis culicivorax TaxID=13658 RepID=A0A915K260_ROMCU